MSEKTNNTELVEIYKEEAQHLIGVMRDGLSRLKENTDDGIRNKLYWESFRCAHTLKGSSGCAGFHKIGEINKILTEIFRSAREGKFKINADFIPLLSEAVEACQRLLNEEEVGNYDELMKPLKTVNRVLEKRQVQITK